MTGVKKYRKKPIDVEAIKWTGSNLAEVQQFVGVMQNMDGDVSTVRFLEQKSRNDDGERIWNNPSAHLWVEANLAWVPVPVGQWVLKDRAGFYPCRADIFDETYEENN